MLYCHLSIAPCTGEFCCSWFPSLPFLAHLSSSFSVVNQAYTKNKNKTLGAALLTTSMRRGLPDAAATGRRVGQPGQMGLGTQRGGQRVHTPAYRGAPVAASTAKGLVPQGSATP